MFNGTNLYQKRGKNDIKFKKKKNITFQSYLMFGKKEILIKTYRSPVAGPQRCLLMAK